MHNGRKEKNYSFNNILRYRKQTETATQFCSDFSEKISLIPHGVAFIHSKDN